MHQAQSYIDTTIRIAAGNTKLANVPLSATQSAALRLALAADASAYVYSGAISIADAIRALDQSLYTWATVKLYYATFYLSRSLLASQGTAIFYDGTKPFSWQSLPGAIPVKRDGPTHKAVLSTFSAVLPNNPLLSQPIGTTEALSWLMQRREDVNYSNARFCEPDSPDHFTFISREGVRRPISAYVQDNSYLYAFDPEHAMLALPIQALKLSLLPRAGRSPLSIAEKKYIASLYFDKTGPLAELVGLFK